MEHGPEVNPVTSMFAETWLTTPTAARKDMSESLASFVPTIVHNADRIATRLDLFRTSTLAGFEPTDEKKEDTSADLDHLFGGNIDLEHFVIPDIPIVNSRAGLYIYLNAAVGLSDRTIRDKAC